MEKLFVYVNVYYYKNKSQAHRVLRCIILFHSDLALAVSIIQVCKCLVIRPLIWYAKQGTSITIQPSFRIWFYIINIVQGTILFSGTILLPWQRLLFRNQNVIAINVLLKTETLANHTQKFKKITKKGHSGHFINIF